MGSVSVDCPLTKPDWCGLTSELEVNQVAIDTGQDNAFS